ncbi:MAG TPA: SRPBCC family protein [Rhizomicrobium sp.]|jgi:carbon monoxide dehydrogenase subunit G
MASIVKDFHVNAPIEDVWDALRDFYAVHERLAPGFLTAVEKEPGARVVRFANGSVAREVLVSIDDDHRRLVYTIPSERLQYHGASAQVFPDGKTGCRFVWITDLLPDAMAPYVSAQMDEGVKAMVRNLEEKAKIPA